MLVLRNSKFTSGCVGKADLLSELVGQHRWWGGAADAVQVRKSWRQLVREGDRDRARGALALAVTWGGRWRARSTSGS